MERVRDKRVGGGRGKRGEEKEEKVKLPREVVWREERKRQNKCHYLKEPWLSYCLQVVLSMVRKPRVPVFAPR